MKIFQNTDIEDLPGDIWRDIEEYEGYYQISTLGRIKSIYRDEGKINRKGRTVDIILKTAVHPSGYIIGSLCVQKKRRTITVHRLVASAFIDNPLSKREVNHKDGDKSNNLVENLEWSTRSEQMIHRHIVLGYKGFLLGKFGKDHPNYGKTGAQHKGSRPTHCVTTGKSYDSATLAAKDMGLNPISVALAARKPESSLHGYKFRYL